MAADAFSWMLCFPSPLSPGTLAAAPVVWQPSAVSDRLHYQAKCAAAFPGSPAERWLEKKRGITPETAERFGVGYDSKQTCITFPYWLPDGSIHRFKLRDKNGQRYTKGQGVVAYGLPTLDSQPRIFVTEGETDTLRLAQELGTDEAVMGVPGASSIGCLEAFLPQDVIIYCCFDNDKAGHIATAKAIEIFGARSVILPQGSKDICEFFQAGHSLEEFLALVAAADRAEEEADAYVDGLKQTVAEATAAGAGSGPGNWLIEDLKAATRQAYQQPRLEKLQGQPPGYLKAVIPTLAQVRPLDYSRARKRIAKDGDVSVSAIDAEVIPLRPAAKSSDDAQGSTVEFPEDEPWPWPVDDGAALLDDLAATFSRFIVLPDHGAATLALWTVFSHALDAFDIAPILALVAPEKRCGKSNTLIVLSELVPRPLLSGNVTASSLFRAVEKWGPTLLADEAETYLKDKEEFRGIINCGHTRKTAFVVRSVGDDHEPKRFKTWAAKALAMIGTPPDTIKDRSIIVRLRRKGPGEEVERLRLDRLDAACEDPRRKAAKWSADNLQELKDSDPETPPELHDRAADNWRPLIAIADLAGGKWPEAARQAAIALSGDVNDDSSARVQLLADIRQVFNDKGTDRLFSAELVAALVEMEDRPWPEWRRGLPLSAASLARLLGPFDVSPKTLRIDTDRKKGYELEDFTDVFSRYLPEPPN